MCTTNSFSVLLCYLLNFSFILSPLPIFLRRTEPCKTRERKWGGIGSGSLAVKKLGNKGKKGKSFKAETIKRMMSPRSKYYCFNLSRASGTQNVYLVGQPWSPTIIINGPSTFKCILLALNRDGNYEMKIYVNT